MFRAIRRHFREATAGISRHFGMSFASAFAIAVTLLLTGLLLVVVANVSLITVDLQESVQIFVKINEEVDDNDISALQKKVENVEGVKDVEYSDKDSELDKLIEEFGDAGYMFEAYRDNNPLSRAFIVDVTEGYSISEISSEISAIDGISVVEFGGETTEQYVEALGAARTGIGIFVLALMALAFFLVYNTIQITINSRGTEIEIMRYVGATNWTIRAPFVWEGILLGILGSIVPVGLVIYGYDRFYEMMNGQLISGLFELIEPWPFVGYVSGFLVVVGIVVGVLGSYFAVSKNLRRRR